MITNYEIYGEDIQYIEFEIDTNESLISGPGSMLYKNNYIEMNTILGNGNENENFFNKLANATKRLVTGESFFLTIFTNKSAKKEKIAFATSYPSKIIPISLSNFPDNEIICQKDAFLVATKDISIDIYLQKKILTGLFGGEGFIMQKLSGKGDCFINAGGTLKEITLNKNEVLHLDPGCLVAMTNTVDFNLEYVGNAKNLLFGGEGIYFATLKGPGKIWIQSLPFSRLVEKIGKTIPKNSKNE